MHRAWSTVVLAAAMSCDPLVIPRDAGIDVVSATDGSDAGAAIDGASSSTVFATCAPGDGTECALPPGRYVPETREGFTLVYVPANNRYVNEPTLIRDAQGTWHMFSNGATGIGAPWMETQMLHATAPTLLGPWTEQPDVLSTRDADATERVLWAPFAMLHDGAYRLFYYDGSRDFGMGLHVAHSTDLFHFTRDAMIYPGGRDPMILRTASDPFLLYSVGISTERDGLHDTVALFASNDLASFGAEETAVRNPDVCPDSCWGFYESPFALQLGGQYYLMLTYTRSSPTDYNNTQVFRSDTPHHFEQPPITTLVAHGAELHVDQGRMYLTRGGWPDRIGTQWRGLSVAPITWVRAE